MIITLDNTLVEQPIKSRYILDSDSIFDFVKNDKNKKNEIVFTDLPIKSDNIVYHYSYLRYLSVAWAYHRSIVIAPQYIWYTITSEIARRISENPDNYRDAFTTSDEKIKILQEGDHLDIIKLMSQLNELTPIDYKLFSPTLSTNTINSELALSGVFAEAASHYYDYMMFCCGIPKVKITGLRTDWLTLLTCIDSLVEEFIKYNINDDTLITYLINSARPIIKRLYTIVDSNNPKYIDIEWLSKIISTKKCGSGGDLTVSGWYKDLYIMPSTNGGHLIKTFPSHITKIPYKQLYGEQNEYLIHIGMFSSVLNDGFWEPEFSQIRVKKAKIINNDPTSGEQLAPITYVVHNNHLIRIP